MTPQEAAEQYANQHWGYNYITENKAHDEKAFIAGQQWQSEQDNQALSSALKKIDELRTKNEVSQLFIDNGKKVIAELHAKIKELESK